jgi:hypothetical protein
MCRAMAMSFSSTGLCVESPGVISGHGERQMATASLAPCRSGGARLEAEAEAGCGRRGTRGECDGIDISRCSRVGAAEPAPDMHGLDVQLQGCQ